MIAKLFAASLLASSALVPLSPAGAQNVPAGNSAPQPTPQPPAIPAPRDVAYPGTITLDIDATDTDHRIFTTHETIPVAQSGPMILLSPQWLPGNHGPRGE